MPSVRLQKWLASAGVCSRRKGEVLIQAGRVAVNGQVVTELGTKIDPAADRVAVDGMPVAAAQEALVYIIVNKPRGVVTSCEQEGVPVVVDLVTCDARIYPVGRLDKDSTGLVLLTNDGRLHHGLLHPSFDHEKEYEVTVARPIPDGALHSMAAGMPLMGSKTRPATVKRRAARRFQIILKEGKNRQIRRMVRKVGNHVVTLKRVRMTSIRLGKLKEGQWRHLTDREVERLLQSLPQGVSTAKR
ncbi:MAG: rRNA pseudouridine synthase [Desulfobacteraceae bacterium]|nr:rRNA pseudouridine synthase [Desulfobacteraceae bacterium]MBC2751791.1 rRNA pseudouridine synthase [Desulfobacteraceae bacterium]